MGCVCAKTWGALFADDGSVQVTEVINGPRADCPVHGDFTAWQRELCRA